MDKTLLDYFIDETGKRFDKTDKRFDQLEAKVDLILKFKWQIIGGSLVASIVITAAFDLILAFIERHG